MANIKSEHRTETSKEFIHCKNTVGVLTVDEFFVRVTDKRSA
jgi:hypothetical protein